MNNNLRIIRPIPVAGAKCRCVNLRLVLLSLVALATSLASAAPGYANGLVIVPTFDTSIVGNANAAEIEAGINNAIGIYESLYADPIIVPILFRYSTTGPNGSALPGGTLAQSNYTLYAESWNTYMTALIADGTTANDLMAKPFLPVSPLATNIDPSSADGRAVGLNTPPVMFANGSVGAGGTFDGIVTLNSGQPIQFSRGGGIDPNHFDEQRLVEHEIDEVLGLGSILPSLTDFTNHSPYRPQDLFRYSSPGTRSLSASGSATSYFSINGGITSIVGFNQNPNGDYGDWLSPNCPQSPELVQYAFTCPGGTADISATSPEGVNLDVIGYDLASSPVVPEPSTLLLLGTGLAAILGSARRKWLG